MGYLPFIPGTWGSLGGVLVYFFVRHNMYLFLGALAAVFFAGFYTAGKAEDVFGRKDERKIVIDEAAGLLLLFLLVPPHKAYLITAFILYRLFDFLKPYPAKRLERLPRSWGIMADDIIAALYSYVVIAVLGCFAKYIL